MVSNSHDRPVALITGSSRGCGHAIAADLHARGYRVAALNRTRDDRDWVHDYACDLTAAGEPYGAVRQVVEDHGRIDVCVSNAVQRIIRPLADLSDEDWERAVTVNLTSVFRLVKATLPAIRAARGSYVIMGSHAATHHFEGGASYSSTKAAVKALVETLLLEERQNGVRATLVNAGAIANRADDTSPYKISPESVAACVGSLIQDQNSDLAVGEIEIRPARLSPVADGGSLGLERLQRV